MPAREPISHILIIISSFAKRVATGLWAGSLAAAAWTTLALSIAIFVFRRAWPLGILLPFGAIFCLAIAWFHYLRDDGLGKKPEERSTPIEEAIPPAKPSRTRRALVWAAVELVVLAAALYSFAGVGRTY